MTTLALNSDWDLRIEPEYVDSDAFNPKPVFPNNDPVTIKTTSGCDDIAQKIKQNILFNDISIFAGDSANSEVLSALIKSSIMDVEGVISISSFSINKSNYATGVVGNFVVSFQVLTTCGIISSRI